jgi:hypothetical protein
VHTLAALGVPPTARMRRLFAHLEEDRGTPSDVIVYGPAPGTRPGALATLDVAIWDAPRADEVTTLCTVGMSERLMKGASYRVELRLDARGRWTSRQRSALAVFLANVSEYPFMHDLRLDWWERLANPGPIPGFPGCTQVLLAPGLGSGAFERFPLPDDDVKVLRVVPITPHENQLLKLQGRDAFLEYRTRTGVDIFAPRVDSIEV